MINFGDYLTDVEYINAYFSELKPLHVYLSCVLNGIKAPEIKKACELGFGQGLSLNIHASTCRNIEWWGCDFNPSMAHNAVQLSKIVGNGAHISADSFESFLHREDVPKFDFIALHGIWSWVSDKNQSIILKTIDKLLNDNGVLYVSYNTPAGWADLAPIQPVIKKLANEVFLEHGDSPQRCKRAFKMICDLLTSSAPYARNNPAVIEHLKIVSQLDPIYLAHEYLNDHWQPLDFSEIAKKLMPLGLEYVGQASPNDQILNLHVDQHSQKLIEEIDNVIVRESMIDLASNRQLRKDYWIRRKIDKRLSIEEQTLMLKEKRFILTKHPSVVSNIVKGRHTEVQIPKNILDPLLGYLIEDQFKPKLFKELQRRSEQLGLSINTFKDIILLLLNQGALRPVQDRSTVITSIKVVNKINSHLLDLAKSGVGVSNLASSVLGGGYQVNHLHQLFLIAIREGLTEPSEWGKFVASYFAQRGQVIQQNGKDLDFSESVTLMQVEAEKFKQNNLPILNQLGIGKVEKKTANNITTSKKNKTIIDQILLQFKRGNFNDMESLAREGLKHEPNNAKLKHFIGMSLLLRFKSIEAIEVLEEAIALDSNDPEIWDHLGVANNRIGKRQIAEECYQKSLAILPNRIETLTNASKNAFEDNRYSDAENYARRALALDSTFAKAYGNLGNALKGKNQRAEAIACFREAIKYQPNYPEAFNNLGVLLYEEGKREEGISCLEKAIALAPGDADSHNKIAALLKEDGKLEESIEHFRKGISALMLQPLSKPPAPKQYMDVEVAHKALLELKRALDKEGFHFFLAYGTLLGVIRDGDLLPHDKDMDVGLPWETDRIKLIGVLRNKYGFVRSDSPYNNPESDQWNISVVHRDTGITIDFFFFKKDGSDLISGIHHIPTPLYWRFTAFETVDHQYLGETWQIPNPPDKYLNEIYGFGWREPDPYFDSIISGLNRNPESLNVALTFAYNRLFDRIDRGEWKKAAGYCRQIMNFRKDDFLSSVESWLNTKISMQG